MSATRDTTIWCDGKECNTWTTDETAKWARYQAKELWGWYRVGRKGLDFCSRKCFENPKYVDDVQEETK